MPFLRSVPGICTEDCRASITWSLGVGCISSSSHSAPQTPLGTVDPVSQGGQRGAVQSARRWLYQGFPIRQGMHQRLLQEPALPLLLCPRPSPWEAWTHPLAPYLLSPTHTILPDLQNSSSKNVLPWVIGPSGHWHLKKCSWPFQQFHKNHKIER